MLVAGGAKEENLRRAEAKIAMAAGEGAQLVLLPETLDLGWPHPSAGQPAEVIPCGEPYQRLSNASRQHGVFVCAGLTELDHDKVFNSAVLIDDSGQLLLRHRKLNELRRWASLGTGTAHVASLGSGTAQASPVRPTRI